MSKSKSVKPVKATDPLTKVKGASVTKPAQSLKSKSKDMAKTITKKPEIKKKVKEPTPESSSDEEEESESSASESESDVDTKATSNGKVRAVKVAAKAEESDDDSDESESDSDVGSDSEESDAEVDKVVPAPKAKDVPTIKGSKSDSEASDSDESTAAENDSDVGSDEDESEDEVPTVSAVMGAQLKKDASKEEDSDDSSVETESDEGASGKGPSKAAPKVNGIAKKTQATSDDESADDSDDESADSDAQSDESDSSDESEEEAKPKSTKRKAEEEAPAPEKRTKVETVDETKKTLFVGNLSWNVTEDWLQQEFEEFGTVVGCRIVTERPSGRSKGYGYVDFEQAADAAKAHKAKAGTDLDGRPLNVDFANAKPSNDTRQENRRQAHGDSIGEPTDTLFIGNMSFDADQDSISTLFQPYGTIMGVRIPTNYETGAPKGYAYVTFSSVEEAQAGLEAMQGAYLNNRPMRLDFSQPRPSNGDGQRGGFGGRGRGSNGRGRGGFDRGGRGGGFGRGGRGGFDRGGRGGRGAGRGASTNRGGFNDFKGQKVSFD